MRKLVLTTSHNPRQSISLGMWFIPTNPDLRFKVSLIAPRLSPLVSALVDAKCNCALEQGWNFGCGLAFVTSNIGLDDLEGVAVPNKICVLRWGSLKPKNAIASPRRGVESRHREVARFELTIRPQCPSKGPMPEICCNEKSNWRPVRRGTLLAFWFGPSARKENRPKGTQ